MSILDNCSVRLTGEHEKKWQNHPDVSCVLKILDEIYVGKVECLTLYSGDRSICFLGKPGNIHICLFVSDEEEYIFDDGSNSREKIAIAGDYWKSFQICRDLDLAKNIALEFFYYARPWSGQKWLHYISEDNQEGLEKL